jgi:hypothetical protein
MLLIVYINGFEQTYFINLNKTHCVQFKTKNKSTTDLNIVCNNRLITTLYKVPRYKYKRFDELEWSCRIHYSETELGMLYHEECEALHACLLLLFQCYYELRFTLLGKFTAKFKKIYNEKKIRIMTSCNNRVSSLEGWKFCPLCRNIFSHSCVSWLIIKIFLL